MENTNAMIIGIATATINGIDDAPSYSKDSNLFQWCINFSKRTTVFFKNSICVMLGNNKEDAILTCDILRKNIHEAGIYDGSAVNIIYDVAKKGDVIAINTPGSETFVDFRDNFSLKTFHQLNVSIKDLFIEI